MIMILNAFPLLALEINIRLLKVFNEFLGYNGI